MFTHFDDSMQISVESAILKTKKATTDAVGFLSAIPFLLFMFETWFKCLGIGFDGQAFLLQLVKDQEP